MSIYFIFPDDKHVQLLFVYYTVPSTVIWMNDRNLERLKTHANIEFDGKLRIHVNSTIQVTIKFLIKLCW